MINFLRYPQYDRSISLRASVVSICDQNICAAMLVSFFEENHPPSGWQAYTILELERALCGAFSEELIYRALSLLERKGIVSKDVPKEIKATDGSGRKKWYSLLVDVLVSLLDTVTVELPEREPEQIDLIQSEVLPTPKPKMTQTEADALEVFRYRDIRRIAYWEKRGRRVQESKPDAKRIRLIADRRAHFTLEQLCLVIEGNLSSDWHQGNNDKSMIHDKVERMFDTNARVEFFIDKAIAAGITEDHVRKILSGAPDVSGESYERLAKMLLPYAVGEEADLPLLVKQTVVAYGKKIDLGPLKETIVPMIERKTGMYGEEDAERLRAYALALRNYE